MTVDIKGNINKPIKSRTLKFVLISVIVIIISLVVYSFFTKKDISMFGISIKSIDTTRKNTNNYTNSPVQNGNGNNNHIVGGNGNNVGVNGDVTISTEKELTAKDKIDIKQQVNQIRIQYGYTHIQVMQLPNTNGGKFIAQMKKYLSDLGYSVVGPGLLMGLDVVDFPGYVIKPENGSITIDIGIL